MAILLKCGALAAGMAVCVASSHALSLTGICGFPTDANGNWKIGWYNTHGPDVGKNGYVALDNVTSGFVNSGNAGSTEISIDLNTVGTHRLFVYFDGSEIYSGRDFWGVNLFFNGHNDAAGISAFGHAEYAVDLAAPQFFADSANTLNKNGDLNIAGAGTLVYSDGNRKVTLTSYSTTADVYNFDRVDNFKLGSSGRNDHVTVLDLTVVPEPASMAVIGVGILGLIRRRTQKS